VELIATLGLGYANPKGFAAFEQGQVFWGLPEVLRLEAERLVEQDRTRAAALLQRAEDIAAQQGALAWQLRIAMTRMRLEFGSARALRALEETFSQYTEGFDSADLVAAQQLVSGR
jgi:predicted ATPase